MLFLKVHASVWRQNFSVVAHFQRYLDIGDCEHLGGRRYETGLMFLGSFIGDHVKTAIGTLLPTGCAIGVGANLFGSSRAGAEVPPFAWGLDEPGLVLQAGRFVEIAERVMPRRDVAVDERTRRYLAAVWGAATGATPCG